MRLADLFALLRLEGAPLDLQLLGRTLMHTVIVGLVCGLHWEGGSSIYGLPGRDHPGLDSLNPRN